MYNTKELPLYKAITSEEDEIAKSVSELIEPNSKILDVGCGSGSIALKIKNLQPQVIFDAIELDISQLKINYVFDKIYNLSFENFEFEQEYDIILLSHVLGHFNLQFRYNQLLEKIIKGNPNSKIIIVTNALVEEFKIVQESIWDIAGNNNYYIDLEKLLNPIINKYLISFYPLTVNLFHSNKITFYKLLETFSPIPLPDNTPEEIQKIIESDIINTGNKYELNIPQFVICIELKKKSINEYKNLNHLNIWQDITS